MTLRLLAVDTLGGAVRHATAEAAARRTVRIGSADSCCLRLDGLLPIAAELELADRWHVRFPATGRFAVEDGAVFQLGAWTVLLLVDEEEAPSVVRLASERLASALGALDDLARPCLVAGSRRVPVDAPRPVLLGTSERADVPLGGRGAPFAAAARHVRGRVFLYPLVASRVVVRDRLVTARTRLRDGDRLLLDGVPVEFQDPTERVATALGERDEAPASVPLAARCRALARRVPWLEVSLVGSALLVAAAFAALYVARF